MQALHVLKRHGLGVILTIWGYHEMLSRLRFVLLNLTKVVRTHMHSVESTFVCILRDGHVQQW